jgi:hypothetical protein
MRIRSGYGVALAFVVMSCTSQRDSARRDDRDGGARSGGAAADAARGDGDAVAQAPPDTRDASAQFVECEPLTLPPFGLNSSFVCDRCAPHGTCTTPDFEQGECQCAPEYRGSRCELCAHGYVERDGQCVTPCQAAAFPCAGTCTGTVDAPACECPIGRAGEVCDRCSPGFAPDPRFSEGVTCIPTCGDGCESDEQCVASSADEQRCACMVGYERDAAGRCVWQGLTADPEFLLGCAHWQLFRKLANSTDIVLALIRRSELVLSVDHRCSTAGATAEAYLPAAHTMPGAALAVTASGSDGATLYVTFDASAADFAVPGQGERVTGTGESRRQIVCLPRVESGREAAITLTVGEAGTCADALDAAFTVQALEVVTDPACED